MVKRRLTVCQLPDEPEAFARSAARLAQHARRHRTDLLLMPEMPAYPWLAHRERFDARRWMEAISAHDRFVRTLPSLAAAAVLSSRPLQGGGRRINQGFVWTPTGGYRAAHEKAFLPNEPGFFEARWFDAAPLRFETQTIRGVSTGFQICTEIMFNRWARHYGRRGAHLIVCPRTSSNAARWEVALRMAAVASGCYVASSNRTLPRGEPSKATFGGEGWIIDPEGNVLARTTRARPFATVTIDTKVARRAKSTYPRYIADG